MSTVTYEVVDGVAQITLSRPESLNAVNHQLTVEVGSAFARAERDNEVRAVILAGAGRAFCAGADLKDPTTHNDDDIVEHMQPSQGSGLEMVARCSKPVVAAVQGYCVGAGVEMAISADVVIAGDNAVFFLPQVALGIVPGAGGLSRLVRQIGPKWTARMALLGQRIDAETALKIGLVSEIVSPDELSARATAIAETLAGLPAAAVRLAKESIAEAQDLPLASALRADKYRLFALSGTEEKKTAHAAFAQGRA